jgi:hypothetical protein
VNTTQIILVILIGLPIAGSILLVGAVMGGRAAMRNAIESGRVQPQCPHPNCPYRQLGPVPPQAASARPPKDSGHPPPHR